MSKHEGPGLFEQLEQSQRSCCIVPAALQFGNPIPLLGNSPLRLGQALGRLLYALQLALHSENPFKWRTSNSNIINFERSASAIISDQLSFGPPVPAFL
jgi:hypothetical protein